MRDQTATETIALLLKQFSRWELPDEIVTDCGKNLGLRNSHNRPFPSSRVPRFQNESKCETVQMKMSSACSFMFMQIKVIFIRMVSHLDSL